jgi:GMP synthase (glutamine-hydrolysing)
MMCRWTIRGAHRMDLPGAKQRVAHFEDRWVYDYGMQAWLANFLDQWLGVPSTPLPSAAKITA